MNQHVFSGQEGNQSPRQAKHPTTDAVRVATQSPSRNLWKEAEAAAYFGVCTRKFHEMRRQGLVPDPIVLGPRALRWVPSECEQAAQELPRARVATEPAQLARARIERMKAGAAGKEDTSARAGA